MLNSGLDWSVWLVAPSCLTLRNPVDCSCQAPLSMGFPRQEDCSGLPFPSPGDLPNQGMEPTSPLSPALQEDSLPPSHGFRDDQGSIPASMWWGDQEGSAAHGRGQSQLGGMGFAYFLHPHFPPERNPQTQEQGPRVTPPPSPTPQPYVVLTHDGPESLLPLREAGLH